MIDVGGRKEDKHSKKRSIDLEVSWLFKDIEHAKLNIMGESLMKFGLFPGQPRLLHLIEQNPGSTQNQIAKKMRVSPSSLSMSIKRLEKQKLVVRETPESDLRRNELHLTEEGVKLSSQCREVLVQFHEDLLAGFEAEEKEQLRDMLKRVMRHLEEHPLYSRAEHHERKRNGDDK